MQTQRTEKTKSAKTTTRPVYSPRPAKKSETIKVENFKVITPWVSVKINVCGIIARGLVLHDLGVTEVASSAVNSLALEVICHACFIKEKGEVVCSPREIIRSVKNGSKKYTAFSFPPHTPGQKLETLELRMKASEWDGVKIAASLVRVPVAVFCNQALHERAVQIADFRRSEYGQEGRKDA